MSMNGPYDDLIMDHIKNARNYRANEDVNRRASGINPLCGDEMALGVKIVDERIVDIAFQCGCCGISMASASIMTGMVKNRFVSEAITILQDFVRMLKTGSPSALQPTDPERLAVLETVRKFPSRVRCAALPWETLESALDDGARVP